MKKLSLLLFIILTVILSCKKENIGPHIPTSKNEIATPEEPSSISDLFKQNTINATQHFTINATSNQYITGAEGTIVHFPPNTFEDKLGNPITGNIKIELIEVLDKATMIWLNKTTTSNGQLLESGGEVKIVAFQNNNKLKLSQNASIYISMPTNNPKNMFLFTGVEGISGDINWLPTNTSVSADSAGFFNFIASSTSLGNDSLGWINIDMLYGNLTLANIEIKTPTNHNENNTTLFIYFHNLNSVAPTVWDSSSKSFKSYLNSLPIGEQITTVAISEIDGQLYSSFTPITLSQNHTETILFHPTTVNNLKNDINNI